MSNTSPLINLVAIGQVELLAQLYQAVKPLLEDLRTVAGFWISDTLYAQVLATVGE